MLPLFKTTKGKIREISSYVDLNKIRKMLMNIGVVFALLEENCKQANNRITTRITTRSSGTTGSDQVLHIHRDISVSQGWLERNEGAISLK